MRGQSTTGQKENAKRRFSWLDRRTPGENTVYALETLSRKTVQIMSLQTMSPKTGQMPMELAIIPVIV
jgi:hypothetical protein